MQWPIALLGSASDHGGRIISGQPNDTIEGVPIACQGDLHECPVPGHGVTPIVEGSPNDFIEGKPVAYVGCRTGCGARITQGSPHDTIWVDQPALGSGAIGHLRDTGHAGLDEHFVLQDDQTDQPADYTHYELRVGNRPYQGTTPADGRTDHAFTTNPENVELIAVAQTRLGLKP